MGEIHEFVETGLSDRPGLVNGILFSERLNSGGNLDVVPMMPAQGKGAWHGVAEGKWDLLGG